MPMKPILTTGSPANVAGRAASFGSTAAASDRLPDEIEDTALRLVQPAAVGPGVLPPQATATAKTTIERTRGPTRARTIWFPLVSCWRQTQNPAQPDASITRRP